LNNKKEEVMLYQQGDVLLKVVSGIKGKKLNHLTLAKGESTGHHHTITKGDAELYEHEGILFLKVLSDEATLTHQEHGAVVIPQGEYEVGVVKEYDHFSEEAKSVRD